LQTRGKKRSCAGSFVVAAQYRAQAPFAAAAVFFTTVLSALTVTGWIFAMKLAGLMP